ncbi:hypothetical protein EGW08_013368 [Elysia chlorotica]|uniref:Rad21/Rec8-like protein N-terminal domain-containing protein n=1 Tax=Elysia chlorotica TaxID=188477 RepID=A0A3S0ZN74_ELYCH|nr:hypothetical protein EGW08_013368 [Elysia chlorotica]
MFYNHWYLRKNGRFGLVWLAATQSRVLSRRELAAVNVSMTVSNILEHIPGNYADVNNRPRRFSLYLSSQLMYGSVKVLQKQWEYLLGDLTGLLRRFHPDINPTTDIDLIITRHDPVTLESCVPSGIKDKCYDPFFGIFKENVADIQALLASWDDDYIKREPLDPETLTFKAELGSPNSVTDIQQIQILDHLDTSVSIEIPGEQDLPYPDAEHLAFIQAADQQINISVDDLITPAVSRILADQEISQLLADKLCEEGQTHARTIEETPAAKTPRELPSTPRKPKRRQPDDRGVRKIPRNLDAEGKSSSDDAASGSQSEIVRDGENVPVQQTSQTENVQRSTDSPKSPARPSIVQPVVSPEVPGRGENWLELNSSLQLTHIPHTPSPVRKRQPHKLIIDVTLQMTRNDLKQNMASSSETCAALVLPSTQKKDLFKEPGSEAVRHSKICRLWTRNCKFGLRVSETERNPHASSDISPLESPRIKRKQESLDYETPAKLRRAESMLSGQTSIEQRRDTSAVSAVNESRDRSKSLVGQASDDSAANLSADQNYISTYSEYERNMVDVSLAPLPEEQEQIMSPVPLQVLDEIPPLNVTDQTQRGSPKTTETAHNELLRLVREKAGERGNWTTFRTICPPASSSRLQAISLFGELCFQVAKRFLQVRQDEPYGEIFIWELMESPETSQETQH